MNISITSPRGIASPFFPVRPRGGGARSPPILAFASLRPSGEVAAATHEGEERRDKMQWSWVPETHPWWCARKEERMDAQRWLGPFPPRESRAASVSVKEPVWIRVPKVKPLPARVVGWIRKERTEEEGNRMRGSELMPPKRGVLNGTPPVTTVQLSTSERKYPGLPSWRRRRIR